MKVIKTREFRNNLRKSLKHLPVVLYHYNKPVALVSKPPKGVVGKLTGEFYPKQ